MYSATEMFTYIDEHLLGGTWFESQPCYWIS
jgi:hypothetical protein